MLPNALESSAATVAAPAGALTNWQIESIVDMCPPLGFLLLGVSKVDRAAGSAGTSSHVGEGGEQKSGNNAVGLG